jgi:exosome complex RNA-binding protein Rrp4
MYTGQIYKNGSPLTVAQAVAQNLIIVDGNGDIWLKSDSEKKVRITGDLRLS